MDSVLLSSNKMDYCTPQDFFDELDGEFVFALDAAATDKSAKCIRYFTPEDDGLKQPLDVPPGYAVFCNPPCGRQIGEWVKKAYDESVRTEGTIVLLIPARTDTKYFHRYIYGKAQVHGNAWVSDDARVYGTGHYLNLGPIGSRYGYTTIYRDKNKKAIVVCWCFHGDLDEFERAVHKTHAKTKYEAEYMVLIQLARLREKEWLDETD